MEKRFIISTFITILFFASNLSQAQVQIGNDIDGESGNDRSGYSVSMSDAETIAIGAILNDGSASNAGHVRVYKWNGTSWIQKGADIDGEASNDNSGISVSMPDSNYVSIGAYRNDDFAFNAGHVRIYRWNGLSWIQLGSDIDGEANSDESGKSIYMPDTVTVVIGAENNDGNGSNAGHARIYRWNGTSWVQKGNDLDGSAADYKFGRAVCMPDSNTVAVSAIGDIFEKGEVYIYEWDGTVWNQKGTTIIGESTFDLSGKSISMPSPNCISIGATNNNGGGSQSGHVRIYEWDGIDWVQKGNDLDGEAANNLFGNSVSMPDSNTVAVGANWNAGNGIYSGHTRVFRWDGSAWIQDGIDIDGEAADDQSGFSVNMPNTRTVAIGAYFNGGNGIGSGHTRIYSICENNTVDTITACYPYTWIDGVTYSTSNDTAIWTLTNIAGCDSTITLNLTVNSLVFGTDIQTACSSFTWIDGVTYTSSNNTATYYHEGEAATGCDSLSTLDLTIINSITWTDIQTACSSYLWIDGNTYTSSNNSATFNIVNGTANGCDSLVTLDLTILNPTTGTDVQSACSSYLWIDGNTYTSSNSSATFNIIGGAANGCDSLVTLDLTILSPTTGTDVQSACSSYLWIDGNTYTSSNSSTTFNIIGGASNGCDSLVTLDLTILSPTTGTDVQTACSSYLWIDGNTYTSSNSSATFNIIGGAANGCDSLVTLDLTILNPTTGTDAQTACSSYLWIDGNTYTSSNNSATFNIVGGAANGCDSLVTLDLTISNVNTIITQTGALLTANETTATYQWLDCGNNYSVIIGETNQSFEAIINGNYAVEIISNGCVDTSDCYTVADLGIINNDFGNKLLLYPNPTDGQFSIDLGEIYKNTTVIIKDLNGKTIQSNTYNNSKLLQLNIIEPSGVYILIIETGNKKAILRIIKE